MRKTPIFFVLAFLSACLSCGVPEDDKPGTVTSPLIDRTEIPEGDSGDGETLNEIISIADECLYSAKTEGKNCVRAKR